jgi:hypothetical protein
MLADYDFYKNQYKGITIADANSYDYFAERAGDELALYVNRADETQLKKCACKIADILYSSSNGKGENKKVTSESIAGYYSVSYQTQSESEVRASISFAIKTYLGQYLLGSKRVMW